MSLVLLQLCPVVWTHCRDCSPFVIGVALKGFPTLQKGHPATQRISYNLSFCLSVCLHLCLSLCLSFFCLSVCLPLCLFIRLSFVCLSVCLPLCLSIRLFLWPVCVSIPMYVYTSLCLSISLCLFFFHLWVYNSLLALFPVHIYLV